MTKKIFLFLFVALGLSLGCTSMAAGEVPKLPPLQPANQPVIYDFSDNVNVEGSPYYSTGEPGVIEAEAPTPEQEDDLENPESATPTPLAPTVISEPPTTTYWVLMFAGIAGLIGAIGWVYWRFIRKL